MSADRTRIALPGICLLVTLCLSVAAQDIRLGSTDTEVIVALGSPVGKAGNEQRSVWLYERGVVVFENGKVVSSQIMSEARYRERLAEKKKRAEERAEADRRRRELARKAAEEAAEEATKKVADAPPEQPEAPNRLAELRPLLEKAWLETGEQEYARLLELETSFTYRKSWVRGPDWLFDPQEAFEIARKEDKAVFVYCAEPG